MMETAIRERQKNLSLALVLSAGLHLILMLTLDVSPGGWRHGLQPALTVLLKDVPPDAPGESGPGPSRSAEPGREGRTAARAQPGSSLPLTDRYFRRHEVDVAAVPIERGPLVFPENAYVWRLAGLVVARVYISEKGSIDSIEIVDVEPRKGIFEQAAIEALRQVRYQPALIGGEPVKSQKLIEVKFDPYEDQARR